MVFKQMSHFPGLEALEHVHNHRVHGRKTAAPETAGLKQYCHAFDLQTFHGLVAWET